MKTYQYILLDWDGTLAKTLDVWLEARRIPLEKRGFRFSDEQIAKSFGALAQYVEAWGVKDPDTAMAEMDAIAHQQLPDVALYPGALEMLTAMHAAGKKLALITASPHEFIEHLLKKHTLHQCFDAIIAGDDVTHNKPHPESLQKALGLLGGNKDQAVMIGDSDKDLQAALNAGVDSVLFYPPQHQKFYKLEDLKAFNPTHVVDSLRHMLRIV